MYKVVNGVNVVVRKADIEDAEMAIKADTDRCKAYRREALKLYDEANHASNAPEYEADETEADQYGKWSDQAEFRADHAKYRLSSLKHAY